MRISATVALPLAVGCGGNPPVSLTVTVDPLIATVLHVAWTTKEPVIQQVGFGEDDDLGMLTPLETEGGTDHTATLIGLHADTAVTLQVQTPDDPGSNGDTVVAYTDRLPSSVPLFTEASPITNSNVGPYLLTSTLRLDDESAAVLVLDTAGEVLWYQELDAGVLSTRLNHAGTGVAFLTEHNYSDDREFNTLENVEFAGSSTSLPLPWAHHDLMAIGDDTWAVPLTTFRDVDGTNVAGDQIVEVDASGITAIIWDAFDALPVERNDGWTSGFIPGAADWTHANGIAWDPDEGSLYLSLYQTAEVVKINRETGGTDWLLGGRHSDWAFSSGGEFEAHHAPESVPGGIRLFENGLSTGSRAVELMLDSTTGIATETWSWMTPDSDWTTALGDLHRFEDGSALTSWGLAGSIHAADSAGNAAGELQAEAGEVVGQVTVIPGFYP